MKKRNIVINDLVNFDNIKIVQNKDYFNFSLDSVLLPNFIRTSKNIKNVIDFCTGNLPIPLILNKKLDSECNIYAVEIQKEVYELAKETLKINNLTDRINLMNCDVKDLLNFFSTDSVDLITCNPPYFKVTEESLINENIVKSIARHEIFIKLEDIISLSKVLLKNNGSLCLVHRTERFVDIITTMRKNNIEPKRVRFVYPKNGKESNLVLVEGRKNGNPGLKIESPLYVHDNNGNYTSEVLEMFS